MPPKKKTAAKKAPISRRTTTEMKVVAAAPRPSGRKAPAAQPAAPVAAPAARTLPAAPHTPKKVAAMFARMSAMSAGLGVVNPAHHAATDAAQRSEPSDDAGLRDVAAEHMHALYIVLRTHMAQLSLAVSDEPRQLGISCDQRVMDGVAEVTRHTFSLDSVAQLARLFPDFLTARWTFTRVVEGAALAAHAAEPSVRLLLTPRMPSKAELRMALDTQHPAANAVRQITLDVRAPVEGVEGPAAIGSTSTKRARSQEVAVADADLPQLPGHLAATLGSERALAVRREMATLTKPADAARRKEAVALESLLTLHSFVTSVFRAREIIGAQFVIEQVTRHVLSGVSPTALTAQQKNEARAAAVKSIMRLIGFVDSGVKLDGGAEVDAAGVMVTLTRSVLNRDKLRAAVFDRM
jgi:hypothetical protein